jgi:hypothetical protein
MLKTKIVLPIRYLVAHSSNVRIVKLSVSLPEPAVKFIRKQAAELTKLRGSRVTVSSWLAERTAYAQEQETKRMTEEAIR